MAVKIMRIMLSASVLLSVLLAVCSVDATISSESYNDVDSASTQEEALVAGCAAPRFIWVENLETVEFCCYG